MAVHLLIFQIGFMIFEWGASRRKCSESSMIKHPVMLVISSISTVLFGFGLAYGDPHIIGKKYFLAWNLITDQPNKALNYDLMILMLCTLTVSTMAISALNERQSFITQLVFGIFIALGFVPIITAWTFGHGFLSKLYLQDESACLSLHFVCGICALLGCFFIEPRLCRYVGEDTMVFEQDSS